MDVIFGCNAEMDNHFVLLNVGGSYYLISNLVGFLYDFSLWISSEILTRTFNASEKINLDFSKFTFAPNDITFP